MNRHGQRFVLKRTGYRDKENVPERDVESE